MGKSAPELSLETVIDELKVTSIFKGRHPEHAYLALEKHGQQVYLDTDGEDVEQQLESLMSEFWVPLGFVAYYKDSLKPITKSLDWYADLLQANKGRYSRVCNIVSARLEEAAQRLTNELSNTGLIPRVQ